MARMKTAKGSLGRGVVGGKGSPRKGECGERRKEGREGHLDTYHTQQQMWRLTRLHPHRLPIISAEETSLAHTGRGGRGSRQGTGERR